MRTVRPEPEAEAVSVTRSPVCADAGTPTDAAAVTVVPPATPENRHVAVFAAAVFVPAGQAVKPGRAQVGVVARVTVAGLVDCPGVTVIAYVAAPPGATAEPENSGVSVSHSRVAAGPGTRRTSDVSDAWAGAPADPVVSVGVGVGVGVPVGVGVGVSVGVGVGLSVGVGVGVSVGVGVGVSVGVGVGDGVDGEVGVAEGAGFALCEGDGFDVGEGLEPEQRVCLVARLAALAALAALAVTGRYAPASTHPDRAARTVTERTLGLRRRMRALRAIECLQEPS
jgi:hypothetical protein